MSASKDKGTRGESAVVAYLRDCGAAQAERRALRGVRDAGDVTGIPGVVIEVKACRTMALAEWLDQVLTAVRHSPGSLGVVWHRRVRKGSPADWYCTTNGETFVRLLREAGYISWDR